MIESLNRPHDGATVDERRDFGRELLAALDRLGVQKGDPFVVGNGKAQSNLYDIEEIDASNLGPLGSTETSRKAALDNYPRSGTQRHRVLMALYVASRTRQEIAKATDLPDNSVRPRVKELMTGGWVETTGETRVTETGSDADVLKLTMKGLMHMGEERSMPKP